MVTKTNTQNQKETIEFSWIHNEGGGLGEHNSHRAYRAQERSGKEADLTSLDEWMMEQNGEGLAKGTNVATGYKGHGVVESHDLLTSLWDTADKKETIFSWYFQ